MPDTKENIPSMEDVLGSSTGEAIPSMHEVLGEESPKKKVEPSTGLNSSNGSEVVPLNSVAPSISSDVSPYAPAGLNTAQAPAQLAPKKLDFGKAKILQSQMAKDFAENPSQNYQLKYIDTLIKKGYDKSALMDFYYSQNPMTQEDLDAQSQGEKSQAEQVLSKLGYGGKYDIVKPIVDWGVDYAQKVPAAVGGGLERAKGGVEEILTSLGDQTGSASDKGKEIGHGVLSTITGGTQVIMQLHPEAAQFNAAMDAINTTAKKNLSEEHAKAIEDLTSTPFTIASRIANAAGINPEEGSSGKMFLELLDFATIVAAHHAVGEIPKTIESISDLKDISKKVAEKKISPEEGKAIVDDYNQALGKVTVDDIKKAAEKSDKPEANEIVKIIDDIQNPPVDAKAHALEQLQKKAESPEFQNLPPVAQQSILNDIKSTTDEISQDAHNGAKVDELNLQIEDIKKQMDGEEPAVQESLQKSIDDLNKQKEKITKTQTNESKNQENIQAGAGEGGTQGEKNDNAGISSQGEEGGGLIGPGDEGVHAKLPDVTINTPENIAKGKEEISSKKEGKFSLSNPVKIFKGLFGKVDAEGNFRSAHPDVEGSFGSTEQHIADRYAGKEGVKEIILPPGTTIEVVEILNKNQPMSKVRQLETDAINNSDAQVVKLRTIDSRGGIEEQYIIKDKLITEPKTKTDAIKKGEVQSGVQEQRPGVSEIGQAGETGGGNSLQPETKVGQKEEVNVPTNEFRESSLIESYKTAREASRATDIKAKERLAREKQDLTLPEETLKDKILTDIQDKMRRLDVLQESAKNKGINISDKIDAYTKYELMSSKAKAFIENKWNEIVHSKPKQEKALLDRFKSDGGNIDELGLYMYAKHAPERNAHIAKIRQEEYFSKKEDLQRKINTATENGLTEKADDLTKKLDILEANPDLMPDKGSGMSNEEASKILSEFKSQGKADMLEKYSGEFREKVIKPNLDKLKETGLIDQELHGLLSTYYKDYVPLFVEERAGAKSISGGRGADVKGKDIIRSKGSGTGFENRINPISSSLTKLFETATRGEKNLAAQSFLDLAKEIGGDEFKISEPETRLEYNSLGEPEYVPISAKPESLSKSIELKVNGKPVFVEIRDRALLKAMKGIGVMPSIKLLRNVNSFLRGVNTVYNPSFIFTNFIRDIQTALINASASDIDNIKRNLIKNMPNSIKGIWDNERGIKSEWSDVVDDFKKHGADMSFWDTGDIDSIDKKLHKELEKYNSNKTDGNLRNALGSMVHYWDSSNRVVELSSRVSAYKAAIDAGLTPDAAAKLAKNLTVNFEKSGNFGAFLNSFYLFANAGIQGSAILMKNLSKSQKMRAVAAGLVATSIAIDEMNRMINEKAFNQIDSGIKDRNLIFMKPNGSYIKIPLPYGFNLFKVLGDNIDDVSNKNKNILQGGKDLLLSINNAFNPISSTSLSQAISPTITDPFIQHEENQNWFGGKIYKEVAPFSPEKKAGAKYFNTVRPLTKNITDEINELTGGNNIKSGYIDINPSIADHYINFIGGGLGKFVGNILNGTEELVKGDAPKVNNIPFVSTFYANAPEYASSKIVYDYAKNAYHVLYNKKETDSFNSSLKEMLQNKVIDGSQYNRLRKEFNKGQSLLRLEEKK